MRMHPTTDPGYTNQNGQVSLGRTNRVETDHNQYIYVLHCPECRRNYGANGSDMWQRKCPSHQGGAEGLPLKDNELHWRPDRRNEAPAMNQDTHHLWREKVQGEIVRESERQQEITAERVLRVVIYTVIGLLFGPLMLM